MALTNETGEEVRKIVLSLDQWKCLRATGQVTVRTVGEPITIKLGA